MTEDARAIPDTGAWTLERALNRAFEANPELQIARFTLEREEGVRIQVRAALLPRLRALGSVDERAEDAVDRPNLNLPPTVARYGYDVRVEVRQTVFDGLSSWNALQRQRLMEKQAYLVLRNTANRTGSLVRQAFDAVLLHQAIVAAEAARIEQLSQLVQYTARKRAVGEIAEFELLRAETELEASRAEYSEAQRLLTESEQAFRRLLHLEPIAERLTLEGDLVMREFSLPLNEALSRALEQRPDLAAAETAVEASKAQQRALVGGYLPTLEAYAGYGLRSSYYNSGNELEGWTIGAVAQWDIFDGFANRGRRKAQLAERRIAETRLASVEHQVTTQLRELYQGLAHSRDAIQAQQKSLDLAARALNQARRLYEAGQASLEQVLQSETAHRRAQNSFSEAIYSYNATIAQIEFAVGGQLADTMVGPTEPWKR